LIDVKNVTKYYGKARGVENLTFKVRAGEVYGLVGPNGAGKTTAIKLLLGLIYPDAGEISLAGSGRPRSRLFEEIGFCSGEANFYQDISPQKLFELIDSLREKECFPFAAELADHFSLPLARKIRTLSMGNKQKVNIIQSVMSRPKLLIMDEPTNGLDPLSQEKFLGLISGLKNSGATVFISSHQLYDIERISDRIGLIKDGFLVREVTVEDIRSAFLSEITVAFREKPPAGFFEENKITVKEDKGGNIYMIECVNVNKTVPLLFRLEVKDIEIKKAGLDEYFINFYRDREK
jgi:ABC-2 type transport system ATP-binding protein